jgi:hypothetical protein
LEAILFDCRIRTEYYHLLGGVLAGTTQYSLSAD